MKNEKKLLVGVGTLMAVFIILGWIDTGAIAEAKEDKASAKTEILIGHTEGEVTEATAKEQVNFELASLSIIEKDIQEKNNESRIIIPITDIGESERDSLYSETSDDNGSGTGGAEGSNERPSSSGDRTYASAASSDSAEGYEGTVSASEYLDTGSGRVADEAGSSNDGTGEENNGTGTIALSESDGINTWWNGSAENNNSGFIESEPEQYSDSGVDESGYVESDTDYESEDGSDSGNLIYLGVWASTGYCPNACCCGQWATGYTASGTLATEGRTVACGSLPMGTEIYIEGYGYRIVEDLGVDGEWVDIFYQDHASASAHGLQYVDVYLVN